MQAINILHPWKTSAEHPGPTQKLPGTLIQLGTEPLYPVFFVGLDQILNFCRDVDQNSAEEGSFI